MAFMTDRTPIPIPEKCPTCRGMGGTSRGFGFDACDACAGSGLRTCYQCPVALLGQPCGEHVLQAVVRWEDRTTVYACLNGHRWLFTWRGQTWERIEDRVVEQVAS